MFFLFFQIKKVVEKSFLAGETFIGKSLKFFHFFFSILFPHLFYTSWATKVLLDITIHVHARNG